MVLWIYYKGRYTLGWLPWRRCRERITVCSEIRTERK